MGIGAILEPAIVVLLLFGGTWINRNQNYRASTAHKRSMISRSVEDEEAGTQGLDSSDSLYSLIPASVGSSRRSSAVSVEPKWRKREIRTWRFKLSVTSPNTKVFEESRFSRLIRGFPFLVEVWYWALIYWVYQLGRAFTALTIVEGTVNVARKHAIQLIHLEKALHIYKELDIQHFFLKHPSMMTWINRIYSFIHIPGTILFLVCLFWYTTRVGATSHEQAGQMLETVTTLDHGPLYEARRRTMAFCNLLAFIVFTVWPCMPPRLLSDPSVEGEVGAYARQFGFIDTVHGDGGEGSVWTQNRFCNQYAAMPSLHFGYSLLIGLTIMTIPLSSTNQSGLGKKINLRGTTFMVQLPSLMRVVCIAVGFLYPFIIFVAIIATANHFIVDAVAGAMICGIAWSGNEVLLNFLPVQDWLLWFLRVHFPEKVAAIPEEYMYRGPWKEASH